VPDIVRFLPPVALAAGCLLISDVREQLAMQPVAPMRTIQVDAPGYKATDVVVRDEERAVAGFDDYVVRTFQRDSTDPGFSIYVGFWGIQRQGKSTHSPKNCLPGGGWEPVSASTRQIAVGGTAISVNRYLISNKGAYSLVYYWYQGRGNVESSEYRVKWDLLRDAAMFGRTDEAIVRVIVPYDARGAEATVASRTAAADSLATGIAQQLALQVAAVLPAPPAGRAPLPTTSVEQPATSAGGRNQRSSPATSQAAQVAASPSSTPIAGL
jgi:EpsI family protein